MKDTLQKLSELVGVVEEVDARFLNMEVVEFVRMKVVHPITSEIPKDLWLDVGDVRFHIWTEVVLRTMLLVEEFCVNTQ